MLKILLFLYVIGFMIAIPLMLIEAEEEFPVRDFLGWVALYPIWFTLLTIYVMAVLSYCIIMNRTLEEGFSYVDSKAGNWKIMKFIERFF